MDIHSLSSNIVSQPKPEPVQATQPVAKVEVESQLKSSVVSPEQNVQKEAELVDLAQVQEQVHDVNLKLEKMGLGMAFSVDENTKSSVVRVIDKTTDEVIKQFPSEDSLRVMKNIQEYLNTVQSSVDPRMSNTTGSLLSEII